MNNKNIGIIVLVIVGIIAVALLAFVVGVFKPANNPNNSSKLPEGWAYKTSTVCNVDIPLPPSQDPYVSDKGETWKFQEHTQQEGSPFFPNTAIAIFNNPELGGSGYVAGAVVISCKENTGNDSLDSLAQKYNKYFTDLHENVPKESRVTVKPSQKTTLWGKEALIVNFTGGMFNPADEFYMAVHKNLAYIISKPQHSTDPFIGQTKEQIFSGIKFR